MILNFAGFEINYYYYYYYSSQVSMIATADISAWLYSSDYICFTGLTGHMIYVFDDILLRLKENIGSNFKRRIVRL